MHCFDFILDGLFTEMGRRKGNSFLLSLLLELKYVNSNYKKTKDNNFKYLKFLICFDVPSMQIKFIIDFICRTKI